MVTQPTLVVELSRHLPRSNLHAERGQSWKPIHTVRPQPRRELARSRFIRNPAFRLPSLRVLINLPENFTVEFDSDAETVILHEAIYQDPRLRRREQLITHCPE